MLHLFEILDTRDFSALFGFGAVGFAVLGKNALTWKVRCQQDVPHFRKVVNN